MLLVCSCSSGHQRRTNASFVFESSYSSLLRTVVFSMQCSHKTAEKAASPWKKAIRKPVRRVKVAAASVKVCDAVKLALLSSFSWLRLSKVLHGSLLSALFPDADGWQALLRPCHYLNEQSCRCSVT